MIEIELKIGIITATKDEYFSIYQNFKDILSNLNEYKIDRKNPFNYFSGYLPINLIKDNLINPNKNDGIDKNKKKNANIEEKITDILVLTINSGFGKLNSVSASTLLLERYNIDFIVNFGACGNLTKKLKIGDITIPSFIYESSYAAIEWNNNFHNKNNDIDKVCVGLNKLEKIIFNKLILNFNYLIKVTDVSSEMDIDSKEKKEFLQKKFKADICDWESFSIRKIAHLFNIPSLIIRVISDNADENFLVDYKKNIRNILDRSSKLLIQDILPFTCKICISELNF